jgi:hypothetical protein
MSVEKIHANLCEVLDDLTESIVKLNNLANTLSFECDCLLDEFEDQEVKEDNIVEAEIVDDKYDQIIELLHGLAARVTALEKTTKRGCNAKTKN